MLQTQVEAVLTAYGEWEDEGRIMKGLPPYHLAKDTPHTVMMWQSSHDPMDFAHSVTVDGQQIDPWVFQHLIDDYSTPVYHVHVRSRGDKSLAYVGTNPVSALRAYVQYASEPCCTCQIFRRWRDSVSVWSFDENSWSRHSDLPGFDIPVNFFSF